MIHDDSPKIHIPSHKVRLDPHHRSEDGSGSIGVRLAPFVASRPCFLLHDSMSTTDHIDLRGLAASPAAPRGGQILTAFPASKATPFT